MADSTTAPRLRPNWLWLTLIAVSLFLAVELSFEGVSAVLLDRSSTSAESLGVAFGPTDEGPRWQGLEEVESTGAAAKAGLKQGDALRFDTLFGDFRLWQPGEQVGVTVAQDGERRHQTLVAQAPGLRSTADQNLLIADATHRLLVLGFSLFLLVRGWRNRTAVMLAIMLPGMQLYPGFPWLPAAAYALAVSAIWFPVNSAIGFLWPIFALEISGGASSKRQARLVYGAAVFFAIASWAIRLLWDIGPVPAQYSGLIWSPFILLHQGFGYAVIAANYRRNDAPARNRIKIVVGAFVFFLFSVIWSNIIGISTWGADLLAFAALALLAYGLLKQHLFDLGFAINRTLVFGSVSFVLLAAFGLAEWGVDRFLPESWHEGSMLISAGIAVALFLSFHRLRDWMERHIERLFFSSWQQAEAALKRFVESAGHFEQVPALCQGFDDALGKFARRSKRHRLNGGLACAITTY